MSLMKATIPEAKYLKNSIDAVSKLITEGTFSVSEEGIRLRAMDPAKVAMVDFTLKSNLFLDYDFSEPFDFSLDIDYLSKVLKRAKAREEIGLEIDDDKSTLIVEIKDGYRRRFNIPIISSVEEELPEPTLEFKAKAEIESGFLESAIKDAKLISDEVTFIASENKFKVSAKSEAGVVEAELEMGRDSMLLNLEVEEECHSKYGIDYLEKIIKAEKVADIISIEFSSNYPCKITYSILEKLKLTFILANRIEE